MNKTTVESLMLLPWIGKTAKFVDYFVHDYLKERDIDLTKEQYVVLKYLNDEDGLIQNDLAFITNRSKTALTRLIQTMEKKGLVFRKSSFRDMRINHVYLTPFGRETWEKSHPHFINIASELQEGLSEEEVQVVQKCLERIQQNIKMKTNINQK